MNDVNREIYGLYPTMGPFDGNQSIRILIFLAPLCDSFNMEREFEASAVRLLYKFLRGGEMDVILEQAEASEDDYED